MLDEPACGSHQVYLCHASHTILEWGTNEVPVPVRHTRRLCAWGGVADQAARQGALFDNACNAIPNARRGVHVEGGSVEGPYACMPGSGERRGAGGGLPECLWGIPLRGGRGPHCVRGLEVPPGSHTHNTPVFLPCGLQTCRRLSKPFSRLPTLHTESWPDYRS